MSIHQFPQRLSASRGTFLLTFSGQISPEKCTSKIFPNRRSQKIMSFLAPPNPESPRPPKHDAKFASSQPIVTRFGRGLTRFPPPRISRAEIMAPVPPINQMPDLTSVDDCMHEIFKHLSLDCMIRFSMTSKHARQATIENFASAIDISSYDKEMGESILKSIRYILTRCPSPTPTKIRTLRLYNKCLGSKVCEAVLMETIPLWSSIHTLSTVGKPRHPTFSWAPFRHLRHLDLALRKAKNIHSKPTFGNSSYGLAEIPKLDSLRLDLTKNRDILRELSSLNELQKPKLLKITDFPFESIDRVPRNWAAGAEQVCFVVPIAPSIAPISTHFDFSTKVDRDRLENLCGVSFDKCYVQYGLRSWMLDIRASTFFRRLQNGVSDILALLLEIFPDGIFPLTVEKSRVCYVIASALSSKPSDLCEFLNWIVVDIRKNEQHPEHATSRLLLRGLTRNVDHLFTWKQPGPCFSLDMFRWAWRASGSSKRSWPNPWRAKVYESSTATVLEKHSVYKYSDMTKEELDSIVADIFRASSPSRNHFFGQQDELHGRIIERCLRHSAETGASFERIIHGVQLSSSAVVGLLSCKSIESVGSLDKIFNRSDVTNELVNSPWRVCSPSLWQPKILNYLRSPSYAIYLLWFARRGGASNLARRDKVRRLVYYFKHDQFNPDWDSLIRFCGKSNYSKPCRSESNVSSSGGICLDSAIINVLRQNLPTEEFSSLESIVGPKQVKARLAAFFSSAEAQPHLQLADPKTLGSIFSRPTLRASSNFMLTTCQALYRKHLFSENLLAAFKNALVLLMESFLNRRSSPGCERIELIIPLWELLLPALSQDNILQFVLSQQRVFVEFKEKFFEADGSVETALQAEITSLISHLNIYLIDNGYGRIASYSRNSSLVSRLVQSSPVPILQCLIQASACNYHLYKAVAPEVLEHRLRDVEGLLRQHSKHWRLWFQLLQMPSAEFNFAPAVSLGKIKSTVEDIPNATFWTLVDLSNQLVEKQFAEFENTDHVARTGTSVQLLSDLMQAHFHLLGFRPHSVQLLEDFTRYSATATRLGLAHPRLYMKQTFDAIVIHAAGNSRWGFSLTSLLGEFDSQLENILADGCFYFVTPRLESLQQLEAFESEIIKTAGIEKLPQTVKKMKPKVDRPKKMQYRYQRSRNNARGMHHHRHR